MPACLQSLRVPTFSIQMFRGSPAMKTMQDELDHAQAENESVLAELSARKAEVSALKAEVGWTCLAGTGLAALPSASLALLACWLQQFMASANL